MMSAFTRYDPKAQSRRNAARKKANLGVLCIAVRDPRGAVMGGETSGKVIAKEDASQSGPYMVAVRNLGYCMRCRRACRPQFCHRDEGKGGSIKTDVRLGWPGCADCHALLGGHAGGGRMPKEQRRTEEDELGRLTRAAVIAAGTWPARLERWAE